MCANGAVKKLPKLLLFREDTIQLSHTRNEHTVLLTTSLAINPLSMELHHVALLLSLILEIPLSLADSLVPCILGALLLERIVVIELKPYCRHSSHDLCLFLQSPCVPPFL